MATDRRLTLYTATATEADRVRAAQQRMQRTRAQQQRATTRLRAAVKVAARAMRDIRGGEA